MTTATDPTAPLAQRTLTPDEVWDRLADLRREHRLPAPLTINVHRPGPVSIRLDRNERGHADLWAQSLGIEAPRVQLPPFEAGAREGRWFSYKTSAWPSVRLLPGWPVDLWCQVDGDVDADEHWNGLVLHTRAPVEPLMHRPSQRLLTPDEMIAAFAVAETNGIAADPELIAACQPLRDALRDPRALLR